MKSVTADSAGDIFATVDGGNRDRLTAGAGLPLEQAIAPPGAGNARLISRFALIPAVMDGLPVDGRPGDGLQADGAAGRHPTGRRPSG